MKHMKLGVILLALLLAAMAMVPMVSAAQSCHNPEITTTDNVQVIVSPDNQMNIFDELGLQKPRAPEKIVPFRTYAESKEKAENIMKVAKLQDSSASVIGLYEIDNSQILLISRGDTVLEVVYDGKSVKTFSITPKLLGEKKTTGLPQKVILGTDKKLEYTVTTESRTQLYSLALTAPEDTPSVKSAVSALSTYIVKRSRTDEYRNGIGQTITSLTTSGWFYVNYGSSITSISDYSTWWINPTFPGYSRCYYYTQKAGVGSTSAQLYTHYKFGTLYFRGTMDMWVSCDAWLNANDGGSRNQWVSTNGDGCTN